MLGQSPARNFTRNSIAEMVLFTLKHTPDPLGRTNSTCVITWSRSEILRAAISIGD
jgi:hypothetical protein